MRAAQDNVPHPETGDLASEAVLHHGKWHRRDPMSVQHTCVSIWFSVRRVESSLLALLALASVSASVTSPCCA